MIEVSHTASGVIINGYQVRLRPIQSADMEQLRAWRNSDTVRRQMLNQSPISEQQQLAWFSKLQHDETQQHWVVEYKGTPIGSTNIRVSDSQSTIQDAKVLEAGLYIGEPKYQGNILAFAPTLALYDYCFNTLNIEAFKAVVLKTNRAALNYNEKLGYEITSQGDLVHLYLPSTQYERQTTMLKRFLSR